MTHRSPDDIRGALSDWRARRAEDLGAYDEAREQLRLRGVELARLARAGKAAGLSLVEIARLAGVSRQHVYDVLD